MPNDKKDDYKIIITCGKKVIANFIPKIKGGNDFSFWTKEHKSFDFEYIEFIEDEELNLKVTEKMKEKAWLFQLPDIVIT